MNAAKTSLSIQMYRMTYSTYAKRVQACILTTATLQMQRTYGIKTLLAVHPPEAAPVGAICTEIMSGETQRAYLR